MHSCRSLMLYISLMGVGNRVASGAFGGVIVGGSRSLRGMLGSGCGCRLRKRPLLISLRCLICSTRRCVVVPCVGVDDVVVVVVVGVVVVTVALE